jgi:hypothetical protein
MVAATLENGTDIANGPIDFEPGRTYENARVSLSGETAEIEGLMAGARIPARRSWSSPKTCLCGKTINGTFSPETWTLGHGAFP